MHNDQVSNSSSSQQPCKCCWRSHCFLRWDSGKRTCTLENLSLGTFVVTIGSIRLLLPNVTSGMYRAQTTCAQPEWTVIVNQSHQPYTVTYCIVGTLEGENFLKFRDFVTICEIFLRKLGCVAWYITNSIKWQCLLGSTSWVRYIAIQERACVVAAMKRSQPYVIFLYNGARR